MKRIKSIIILLLLFNVFFLNKAVAQEKDTTVYYSAVVLYTTEELGPEIKILVDSVSFSHDNSIMYCDSALLNQKENLFDAFGNVKIVSPNEEKDTVFIYGDTLHYIGNLKLAKIRNNVKMTKDSLVLVTDSLDYDLENEIGYYFSGGTTQNGEDTLTSIFGYYYSNENEFFFKDSVVIRNPKFSMFSDTLKHHTITKTSYFLGPTEIISDENFIYCENGWYNHNTDISQFNKNAYLQNKDKILKGDSLYYDRNKGIGRAFKNVSIIDTTQDALLLGEYGYYNEKKDYSLMTDSALFIQITENDSLFLHADTLCAFSIKRKPEEIEIKDSILIDKKSGLPVDSSYRVILAYNKAKLFKSDFQAMCDSLVYTFKDSMIELHHEPVMWSDKNQLTADFVLVYTRNDEVKQVDLQKNAFITMKSDSIRYDQIKGDDMIGLIDKQVLHRVDVYNNGKSIYFAKDDDKKLIAINIIECKDMIIHLKDKEIDRIRFFKNPKATLHIPLSLPQDKLKLENFKWLEKYRPMCKDDVFIWVTEPQPEEDIEVKDNVKEDFNSQR